MSLILLRAFFVCSKASARHFGPFLPGMLPVFILVQNGLCSGLLLTAVFFTLFVCCVPACSGDIVLLATISPIASSTEVRAC